MCHPSNLTLIIPPCQRKKEKTERKPKQKMKDQIIVQEPYQFRNHTQLENLWTLHLEPGPSSSSPRPYLFEPTFHLSLATDFGPTGLPSFYLRYWASYLLKQSIHTQVPFSIQAYLPLFDISPTALSKHLYRALTFISFLKPKLHLTRAWTFVRGSASSVIHLSRTELGSNSITLASWEWVGLLQAFLFRPKSSRPNLSHWSLSPTDQGINCALVSTTQLGPDRIHFLICQKFSICPELTAGLSLQPNSAQIDTISYSPNFWICLQAHFLFNPWLEISSKPYFGNCIHNHP